MGQEKGFWGREKVGVRAPAHAGKRTSPTCFEGLVCEGEIQTKWEPWKGRKKKKKKWGGSQDNKVVNPGRKAKTGGGKPPETCQETAVPELQKGALNNATEGWGDPGDQIAEPAGTKPSLQKKNNKIDGRVETACS